MGNINLCCGDDSVGNQRLMRNNPNKPEVNPSRSQTMETLDIEILNATRDNNINHVRYLLENGADINAQTPISKDTPLHLDLAAQMKRFVKMNDVINMVQQFKDEGEYCYFMYGNGIEYLNDKQLDCVLSVVDSFCSKYKFWLRTKLDFAVSYDNNT